MLGIIDMINDVIFWAKFQRKKAAEITCEE